jgi:RluA family pseudouridine synthase
MSEQFLAQTAGRLDKVLRTSHPDWGRKAVDEVIGTRKVFINGRNVHMSSWQVEIGDEIIITHPPTTPTAQSRRSSDAMFDPRWIVHESKHLLVVNKPEGLRSEPTRLNDTSPNLLSLAQERFGELTLAHRLDRDTSGLLMIARTRTMRQALDVAFKDHTIEKRYVAVVSPMSADLLTADEEGVISKPLKRDPIRRDQMVVAHSGGDPAHTKYRVIERGEHRALVHLWPHTGRTHQLRVHMSLHGASILGDRLYGDEDSAERLMLHAEELMMPELAGMPAQRFAAAAPFDITS